MAHHYILAWISARRHGYCSDMWATYNIANYTRLWSLTEDSLCPISLIIHPISHIAGKFVALNYRVHGINEFRLSALPQIMAI